MKKIRPLTCFHNGEQAFHPGRDFEVSDSDAADYVSRDMAVLVEDEPQPEPVAVAATLEVARTTSLRPPKKRRF